MSNGQDESSVQPSLARSGSSPSYMRSGVADLLSIEDCLRDSIHTDMYESDTADHLEFAGLSRIRDGVNRFNDTGSCGKDTADELALDDPGLAEVPPTVDWTTGSKSDGQSDTSVASLLALSENALSDILSGNPKLAELLATEDWWEPKSETDDVPHIVDLESYQWVPDWTNICTEEVTSRRWSLTNSEVDLLESPWQRALCQGHESFRTVPPYGPEVYLPLATETENCNKLSSPTFVSPRLDKRFSYRKMRNPEAEIRLLSRAPEYEGWKLSLWDIETAPPYAALSYEWGATSLRRPIRVNNGCFLRVTPNCATALRQLWPQDEIDYFWIDAICINQKDNDEKGHQVQAMAEIYTRANWTFISLGLHDTYSQQVYNALRSYDWVHDDRMISLLSSQAVEQLLKAVLELCQRSYWQRLWVYQELILSTDLKLLCGRDVASWTSFVRLLGEFERCMRGLDSSSICMHSHVNLPALVTKQSGYYSLMDVQDKRSEHEGFNRTVDMYRLLEATCSRECFDIRDRVFGVMRLVRWPRHIPALTVSYNRRPFEIAIDVLQHYPSLPGTAVGSVLSLVRCLQLKGGDTALGNTKLHELKRISGYDLATTSNAVRIRESRMGHLGFVANNAADYAQNAVESIPVSDTETLRSAGFRLFVDGQEVLGFGSVSCRFGDILLELSSGIHVVLRPTSECHTFEVICRAVLLPKARDLVAGSDHWSLQLCDWSVIENSLTGSSRIFGRLQVFDEERQGNSSSSLS